MPITISASILSADFSHLADQIKQCEASGADWIHIDVMDGHFVPNLTMGPFIVETCKRITSLPLDCHLMIEEPENLIEAFINAGANVITIHPEHNPTVLETIQKIKTSGCLAGLALNPETSLSEVTPLLAYVDLVLIMTVNPGYSGQGFMPETVEKIGTVKKLRVSYPNISYIQVDGGINPTTLPITSQAGANCFVAATAIFKNPNGIARGISELRNSAS